MITKIIEVTNDEFNWGKFLVARMDHEWDRPSVMTPESSVHRSLLGAIGWDPHHIWVLDLQTREGAGFRPGGYAAADLEKHKIWVCPMFQPFLEWLYKQDLSDLQALPDKLNLPDAPPALSGYRRKGPGA